MFTDLISRLDFPQITKTIFHKLADIFETNLPESLFYNHYELALKYGHEPEVWNRFLKIREVDRLIQGEIAQIAEIGARRALANLQSGKASTQDIQAAKELLQNSKLLKQKVNQRETIVLTRIPSKIEVDANGIETTEEVSR